MVDEGASGNAGGLGGMYVLLQVVRGRRTSQFCSSWRRESETIGGSGVTHDSDRKRCAAAAIDLSGISLPYQIKIGRAHV